MLVGEGPYSLCNYTVIRCFFFPSPLLFCNGATIEVGPLSPLCLLSRQLTMEHSAGGDPDPLIVLWQPWPSQLENRKTKNPA